MSLQRKKKRIVEGCGKLWEKNNTYEKGGNIFVKKSKSKIKRFREEAKKKGKQEYRVSGSWNRQPESTWSK